MKLNIDAALIVDAGVVLSFVTLMELLLGKYLNCNRATRVMTPALQCSFGVRLS